MDIRETRKKKSVLQNRISSMIVDFELETGLSVTEVDVKSWNTVSEGREVRACNTKVVASIPDSENATIKVRGL